MGKLHTCQVCALELSRAVVRRVLASGGGMTSEARLMVHLLGWIPEVRPPGHRRLPLWL